MNPQPVSNTHFSAQYRLDAQPNLSSQFSHTRTYNYALEHSRDLDRYTPAISSKTNIYDQTRVVEPLNYFGLRFIKGDDTRQRFFPAGMDMVNSRPITGEAFTKPVVKHYPQNL